MPRGNSRIFFTACLPPVQYKERKGWFVAVANATIEPGLPPPSPSLPPCMPGGAAPVLLVHFQDKELPNNFRFFVKLLCKNPLISPPMHDTNSLECLLPFVSIKKYSRYVMIRVKIFYHILLSFLRNMSYYVTNAEVQTVFCCCTFGRRVKVFFCRLRLYVSFMMKIGRRLTSM